MKSSVREHPSVFLATSVRGMVKDTKAAARIADLRKVLDRQKPFGYSTPQR